MIKIFKDPNDRIVNNFLKKSKGKIVNYVPIIVEYDEKKYVETSHIHYETNVVIYYCSPKDWGNPSMERIFKATDVFVPKNGKLNWKFLNVLGNEFELDGSNCAILDFRKAQEDLEKQFIHGECTYYTFGTSDFTEGRRFENFDVENVLIKSGCLFND